MERIKVEGTQPVIPLIYYYITNQGTCTYMGCWKFFSKRPIANMFYDDIVKRKDVIQIGYSQKLETAIKEYTDKVIVE